MKALADLRTEVELGLEVYPSTNHDVIVTRWEGLYVFLRYDEVTLNGTPREKPSRVPPLLNEYDGHPVGQVVSFFRDLNGDGGILVDADEVYNTFDELLADWPSLSSQPVWSTVKTVERMQYEKQSRERINRENEENIRRMNEEMAAWRSNGLNPFEE